MSNSEDCTKKRMSKEATLRPPYRIADLNLRKVSARAGVLNITEPREKDEVSVMHGAR